MILRNPVSKTVQNHIPDNRIIAVHGVSTAAEIVVMALWSKKVIGPVINALIGDIWTIFIALSSVIKHHIKDYFYSVFM